MNRSNISNDDSGSNYRYHPKQNNDDDDEDDTNNDNNNTGIQTDDLLDLFSTTMHSLAADAAAIRQITDLAELTGIILSDNNGNKKYGNNNNANEEEEEENDKREYVQVLCNLDRLISGVEQKVIALRQIINEENSALTKFETNLGDEADEQATLIEDLMSALDLQQQQQHDNSMSSSSNDRDDDNRWHARHQKSSDDEDEWRYGRYENNDQRQHQYHDKKHIQLSEANSNSNNNNKNNNNTNRKGVLQSRTMGKLGNQSSPHPSRGVNGSRISHNNNNSNRNRNDLYKFSSSSPEKMNNGSCYGDDKDEEQEEEEEEEYPCFVKVTKSEILEQTPSFGVHLSRFDLNEALEEIERMVWNKISSEPKSSIHSSGSSPPSHLSSNTLQRRFDYLRHRQRGPNAGSENETEAQVGHRWVSEQELRENCAFFRSGESTARATLQLLCSLKRLKQVSGKNREVTYLCLFR